MTKAATSIEIYFPFFARENVRRVLDYGAGTLRNSCFLAERGLSVIAVDLPEQVERICRMSCRNCLSGILRTEDLERTTLGVDLVISTYVLNIITDGKEKQRYLKNIVHNLRNGGYLLIEGRCQREETCMDCCRFKAKCEKCAKTFSRKELDCLLEPYGFLRICHYHRRDALAAIYQLRKRPRLNHNNLEV